MATLNVLVVEAEPVTALALETQLGALGHRVLGPVGGEREAVDLARRHVVDAAVVDVGAIERGGEAARTVFRQNPMPMILLAEYGDDPPAELGGGAPFHTLYKPVSVEEIGPAIGVARRRLEEWMAYEWEAAGGDG